MKCNVGRTDRIIRIIVGLLVAIAGVWFSSWWGLAGVVLIVTGLFSFCPAYLPFNINTGAK